MELTINLPDAVFQQLKVIADSTQHPLNNLVLQSISGNLPPSIQDAPEEIRAALLRMQGLEVRELRAIARTQFPTAQQNEHLTLLDKNQSGTLTDSEQTRWQELRAFADQLMLKKAHACAILRWWGIATAMLQYGIHHLIRKNYQQLTTRYHICNPQSRQFYHHLGFKDILAPFYIRIKIGYLRQEIYRREKLGLLSELEQLRIEKEQLSAKLKQLNNEGIF